MSDTEPVEKPTAAEYLKISQRKLDYLMAKGEIPHAHIGRRVIFRRCDLDAFVAERVSKVRA